jgi:hypothetical protein
MEAHYSTWEDVFDNFIPAPESGIVVHRPVRAVEMQGGPAVLPSAVGPSEMFGAITALVKIIARVRAIEGVSDKNRYDGCAHRFL